ncbi:Transcriptional regulator, AraC family protein [Minicystis rosea]|nr:Transcriptional regulator, AraC family protein [Minicystis rosea]
MSEHAEERMIAAGHALQLVELAARWGVTEANLLAGLDLDAAALSDPRLRLPVSVFTELAARAKALTGEPGLGFCLGLQMRISSHGYLGFAAMSAPTLRDALDVAVRFAPTRTDAIALRVHESDGVAAIILDELAPRGPQTDVLVLSLIVGLHEIGAALTGRRLDSRADVALPAPDYLPRFPQLAARMRFGAPEHRIVFDAKELDLPLIQADPIALRLAREQCERELSALGGGGQVATRVRALLPRAEGGFLSIDETAARLGMSPRTLKRRLADEGLTFSELLEEQRRERALLLLQSPDRSIEEVADGVGYSDVANFTRAFRRWTGSTPTAYRRGHVSPRKGSV